MKTAFILISSLALISFGSQNSWSQYGKKGFTASVGASIYGPQLILGWTGGDRDDYGEWYFDYYLFRAAEDRSLVNNWTSGALVGMNYFPKYAGSASGTRLKWLLGFGVMNFNEKTGSDISPRETGMVTFIHGHGGARYFFSEHVTATGWLGYAFSVNEDESVLKKVDGFSSEDYSPLVFSLSLNYFF